MWFLDLYGDEDDLQFIRSIRKACPRDVKNSSRGATKALLKSFLHELSFWEAPSPSGSAGNPRQRGRRRLSPKNSLEAADTMSTSSKVANDVAETLSKPIWKTAVDPATGRTYYYDTITRTTQWNKVRVCNSTCDADYVVVLSHRFYLVAT
jgi:hypothetical protein